MDRNGRGIARDRRGRLIDPHLTCASCGRAVSVAAAHGWKTLLGADLAPAAFCPTCAAPELRRFVAEHRAARSMALAGDPT